MLTCEHTVPALLPENPSLPDYLLLEDWVQMSPFLGRCSSPLACYLYPFRLLSFTLALYPLHTAVTILFYLSSRTVTDVDLSASSTISTADIVYVCVYEGHRERSIFAWSVANDSKSNFFLPGIRYTLLHHCVKIRFFTKRTLTHAILIGPYVTPLSVPWILLITLKKTILISKE